MKYKLLGGGVLVGAVFMLCVWFFAGQGFSPESLNPEPISSTDLIKGEPKIDRSTSIIVDMTPRTAKATPKSSSADDIFSEKMDYQENWCNELQLTESGKNQAADEHNQWLREHGHLLEELEAYKSYSIDTLKKLGQSGDTTALSALAEEVTNK
ncbi:hypothetical protein KO507_03335 [Gilvimarinus agarilyticus]|uniref:hypothetical protein n=1 Tax=Gilvimarinus sp. 2_MG-2023 TaxID=3062666 RepID=UPI001C090C35|nr:hypothetical protein [Gilvimarinus sp. 2_MG-2023]MBU2884795.1 hypothetical protein [Gilvimarinus agarilyticus]MDO6569845.1 hypothetical protein [Gilvimarinus sp. 2_MG-2023]